MGSGLATARLAILFATYLLIAAPRIPFVKLTRPAEALPGAVAMVTIGQLPLRDAYAAIDLDVIVFLLGVLLITGFFEVGGFFEWAARRIVVRALIVFTGALVGWLAGLSLPLVAITAAAVLLVVAQRDMAPAFSSVEWPLLIFFAALFVVMRGARDLPLVASLTSAAGSQLHGAALHDAIVTSAAMVALSNLVSNVRA